MTKHLEETRVVRKSLWWVGIEGCLGGVFSWFGRVVETALKINLGGFMTDHIDKSAQVRTDYWSGYKCMEGRPFSQTGP